MPKDEIVVDPRTGQEFVVVWDAAAERRGETFVLGCGDIESQHPDARRRHPQSRPLRCQPARSL